MIQGYVVPATLLRRGFGNVQKRTLYKAFPGTTYHATVKDFMQFQEGRVTRAGVYVNTTTNSNIIAGQAVAGE